MRLIVVPGRHFTNATEEHRDDPFEVGLLVAAASFVLWLELLVRAAAVYVAVLFLPLAMATLAWGYARP